MKAIVPIKRRTGDQYMHKKSEDYRNSVRRKLHAYHIFTTTGCIAQGLLLHLSMNHAALVWKKFGGWMRTMNTESAPSEYVTANALRCSLPEFIARSPASHPFVKFLVTNSNPREEEELSLAG